MSFFEREEQVHPPSSSQRWYSNSLGDIPFHCNIRHKYSRIFLALYVLVDLNYTYKWASIQIFVQNLRKRSFMHRHILFHLHTFPSLPNAGHLSKLVSRESVPHRFPDFMNSSPLSERQLWLIHQTGQPRQIR